MTVSVVEHVRTNAATTNIIDAGEGLTLAATPAVGDVIVIAVGTGASSGRTVSSITGLGATWSVVLQGSRTAFWKGVGATASGSPTVTLDTTASVEVNMYLVRGASTTVATAINTTSPGPSLTAGVGQFVAFSSSAASSTVIDTLVPASGWTQVTPTTTEFANAYRVPTGAGETHRIDTTGTRENIIFTLGDESVAPVASLAGIEQPDVAAFTLSPIVDVSLGGTQQADVGSFTTNVDTPAEVTLAGVERRETISFTLAAEGIVSLAGTEQRDEGSFSADVSKTLTLAGTERRDTAAFTLAVPPTATLAGVQRADVASFTLAKPPGTVTTNTVAGRTRGGHGVARWEPPVVAPPGVMASGSHAYVKASAFGPVTMRGSQPIYTVSTAAIPRARQRILMGGKDISFWRDTITPDVEVQLAEPLLYGPASVALPQVAACFEKPGAGALRFMRKWAPVVVQLVLDDVVIYELYRGFVLAYDNTGRDLVVQFGGEAQGRAALVDKQEPLFRDNLDLGRLAWRSIRDLGLPFEPRLGPETGIPVGTFGGMGHLDYIADLCAKGWTRAGNQWTIMPDEQGVYRMRRKDTTTVDFTLFADDARTVAALRRDTSEEPNRIFVRGITPNGQRVRNGVYPGMQQSKPAPYPFDDERDFGDGTTNEDTDTGDGISRLIGRLRARGYLSMEDVPGGYDLDVHNAIFDLQTDAGFFDDGFGTTPPGWVNVATWRALYDLDVTGYDLTDSHIEPMAQRRSVRRYRRSANGSIMGRNPYWKAHAIPVDATLEINGFWRQQMREFAQADLIADEDEGNWVGTITLRTGAVLAGDVAVGATVTAGMVRDARTIKPGQNARLPLFNGTGILVHIADVTIREGEVSLLVDTQARDAAKVWEIMNAHRETRNDPARRWRGNRASTQVKDAVDVWDEIGGLLDGDVDLEPGWNVIPVVAGQEGTVSRLRLLVQTVTDNGGTITINGHEYACGVFGRPITVTRLRHLVGNPLAASPDSTADPDPDEVDPPATDPEEDGADPADTVSPSRPWWERRAVANKLRKHDLLLSLGTREDPCGYSPGRKSKGATRTGLERADAGFAYRTGPQPVLYLAVWAWGARTLSGGRVMWNQLEAGA